MTLFKSLTIKSLCILLTTLFVAAFCLHWYLIHVNKAVYVVEPQIASGTPQIQQLIDDDEFKQGIKTAEADIVQKQFTGKETVTEIYNNPYIKHIRVGLNNYLDGNNKGVEEVLAMEESNDDLDCGLKKFDKSYYNSKFVIYDVNDAEMGGVLADISFIDKPDKLFTVWVYKIGNDPDEYSIRGFCKVGPPEDMLEDFIKGMNEKAAIEEEYLL
jgi:hypothetical protein